MERARSKNMFFRVHGKVFEKQTTKMAYRQLRT